MADRFGSRHLVVTGAWEGPLELDVAPAFAALCDRAADHGLLVALEFIPPTNVPTMGAALRIVDEAGRANGGVLFDVWHFLRGGGDIGELEDVPSEHIVAIQLNDGTLTPAVDDYLVDCTSNRLPPGDGEFDLVKIFQSLKHIGVQAPVSLEVVSTHLDSMAPSEAAYRLSAGAQRMLSDVGWFE